MNFVLREKEKYFRILLFGLQQCRDAIKIRCNLISCLVFIGEKGDIDGIALTGEGIIDVFNDIGIIVACDSFFDLCFFFLISSLIG